MNKKLLSFLCFFICYVSSHGQETHIMTMEVKSEIDPRVTRYITLALEEAEAIKADIVILELDTYGGVLTDAKDIVDKIMQFKKPIWVFINSDAASAGALISIACDSIYMSAAASIGAATVVDGNGEKAPDKYQSYMRSIMRSTAEENKRDPLIAEGMVDDDLVIEGIKEAGKIITFSTSEAIKHGFCEAKVETIEDIIKRNKVGKYTLHRFELKKSDKIIAFFLNPFISSLLILAIIGGIYFEMQAPGLGFAGLVALVSLILYLVPYYLNGLAENWEIIALLIGIMLLAVEILILPGFGVAGITGIVLMVSSLVLIMLNNDAFDFQFVALQDILYALAAAMGGLLGGTILLFVGGSKITNTRFYKRIALTDTQDRAKGFTSNFNQQSLLGEKGIAQTVLRPSGRVLINGKIYDAFTRGEYVERDEPIEVIREEGVSLQVKKILR